MPKVPISIPRITSGKGSRDEKDLVNHHQAELTIMEERGVVISVSCTNHSFATSAQWADYNRWDIL